MPESHINPTRRVLVAIDRTTQDKALFNYVSTISKLANLDIIYILHIANSLDIPEELSEKYPDLLAPVDESIKQNIQFEINEELDIPEETKIEIIVKDGNVYHEILKTVKQKGIDMLVLGRKNNTKGNLSLVRRMALTAPCSLSIIPEYINSDIHKVLVPVDFSKNSKNSMFAVKLFSDKSPALEIHTLHAFDVPMGYSKIGKTYEEFLDIMEEHARKDCKQFMEGLGVDYHNIHHHFIQSSKSKLPGTIYQYAIAHGIDVIVVGSKGRGALSHFLLGSVTEVLIEQDQYLPLVIIKGKTEGMDLLEALKNI